MERRTEAQWLLDHKTVNSIMIHNRNAGIRKIYMFLDFDGVVNVFVLPGTKRYEEMQESGNFEFFDRDCVRRLNDFVRDWDKTVFGIKFLNAALAREYMGQVVHTQRLLGSRVDRRHGLNGHVGLDVIP